MNKPYLLLILFALTFTSLQAQLTPTYNDILIPMRDGKFLSADVFIPDGTTEGEVILIQTPYNKNMLSFGLPLGIGMNVDDQPYIFVVVDWRGFYGSAAAVTANMDRGEDGFDVCEWIVAQSWHKDRIGTWGPSALGKIQYDLAFQHHPNHTCAVPIVAHPHFFCQNCCFQPSADSPRVRISDNDFNESIDCQRRYVSNGVRHLL